MVMSNLCHALQAFIVAALGLEAALAGSPPARSQTVPDTITDQRSIFIDGKTFKIIPGEQKADAADRLKALGGRELGPGAIIYRMGDGLFIIGAPLIVAEPSTSITPAKPVSPAAVANNSPAADAKKDEQLGRLRVQYDPPKNPELQGIYQRLKQNQTLETIQMMLSPLRLPPEGLLIKTLECGFPNSWYNDSDPGPTIHMCYELLRRIIRNTTEDVRPNVTRHDAIVGQFLFWTLHETGHAVFDIFQLPLFGREEDAADQFAGYLMLRFGKEQGRRWVEGAAYSAQEFMKDFGAGDSDYSDVHGLPEQRFYNLICLAYGADPLMFADVTSNMMEGMKKQGFLPKNRAEDCVYEFMAMDHAFKTLVRPHVDLELAAKVMDTTWFPAPPKRQRVRALPAPPAAAPAAPTTR
jgi:hypothetical protein